MLRMGVQIEHDFEERLKRHEHDHDPFKRSSLSYLAISLDDIEPIAEMIQALVDEIEATLDKIVIHDF